MRKVLFSILFMSILILAGCQSAPQLAGATAGTQTFTIPEGSTDDWTAPYLILWIEGVANAPLVHKTTGTPLATNSWANSAIVCTDSATGTATNTLCWDCTIPPLDTKYKYGMAILDNASPADSDAMEAGPYLYDPLTNQVFTDTNPIFDNNVSVRNR